MALPLLRLNRIRERPSTPPVIPVRLKFPVAVMKISAVLTASSDDPAFDFVSRCFFPNVGIDEDPVTGSAHTALAPYWTERLGRNGLTGLQASARTGIVGTEVHGDRVHLTGRAVTVLDATLHALP